MSTVLSSETEYSAFEPNLAANTQRSRVQSMPKCYQADQQVKYLHLQAEIDVLWQQLQTLKQDKLSSQKVQTD
jgi:hypothetical protein